MKEITLKLKENEVEAILMAISSSPLVVYWGSLEHVNYKELADKISTETIKQYEEQLG